MYIAQLKSWPSNRNVVRVCKFRCLDYQINNWLQHVMPIKASNVHLIHLAHHYMYVGIHINMYLWHWMESHVIYDKPCINYSVFLNSYHLQSSKLQLGTTHNVWVTAESAKSAIHGSSLCTITLFTSDIHNILLCTYTVEGAIPNSKLIYHTHIHIYII